MANAENGLRKLQRSMQDITLITIGLSHHKDEKGRRKLPNRAFLQTLGTDLFSSWKSRYASIMNVVLQMARENISARKLRGLGRLYLQPNCSLVYCKRAPIFLSGFPQIMPSKRKTESTSKISIAPQMVSKNVPISKLSRFRGFGSKPNPSSFYRRQAPIFVFKSREAVPSKFDADKTKSDRPQCVKGITVPPGRLEFFSRLLRTRVPSIQIHQDEESENFLREHHADALTVGHDIFFRTGMLDLKSPRGLGLLGHELTHVVQQYANDWRNPNVGNQAARVERTAIENERLVLQYTQTPKAKEMLSFSPALTGNTSSMPSNPQLTKQTKPMFADASRNISGLPKTDVTNQTMTSISADEMTRIKEEVYRDLMMRIKVDFERGA